jgi:hypothetical protein
MLAYAASAPRTAERSSSPNAMLAIIAAHVALVALVMSAKLDIPIHINGKPIEVTWIDPVEPPPPNPPVQRTPHPPPGAPALEPEVPVPPSPGPTLTPTPPLPNPGPFVSPSGDLTLEGEIALTRRISAWLKPSIFAEAKRAPLPARPEAVSA